MERKNTTTGVVIASSTLLVLFTGAVAANAATWVLWTLIGLMVPVAVLASMLVIERVRRG